VSPVNDQVAALAGNTNEKTRTTDSSSIQTRFLDLIISHAPLINSHINLFRLDYTKADFVPDVISLTLSSVM
jgi:hypothetical protein